ncbi:bifunctional ornithine acetyltransferase/N-acetylglutamate synthase [Bacillus sp. FJAT-27225]|uniref:bifunctional ornithine acetyltransferase/N-acetylglutamate synthase n=1 Tax=Bacillus sp. FJAT-27225 TaxID=1743144 RepID=UPI00080C21C7|nr:bifunctional ornithine acetyltransferase/N-acetylglutamate synthase [Bacillus sp. FJAT-27225]OCA83395.1 bifunctional ornithine acetyltransferase/N-acetylglutamate synthase [Bacillus sp. FJAT-27225]
MSGEKIIQENSGVFKMPKGFKAGGLHCGLKRKKEDLGYITSEIPATAAGVYTVNSFQAAPLHVTKKSLEVEGKIQALLVNSGNANACTGNQGIKDAYEMQSQFANELGIPDHLVAVTSTGVIGELLPMACIRNGINKILNPEYEGPESFQKAILTTDTCIKSAFAQVEVNGKLVTISGAAKGSGMIHPNMATMLAFVTTDAYVEQPALLSALKESTNQTFNMITVDGDSSTNDMVLAMANGLAGNELLNESHPDWEAFSSEFKAVCESLAKQIARDGEGATKLLEVRVSGAQSLEAARAVGKAVISSNLVKTAIYGEDANWGRIVAAIGYSGISVNPEAVEVAIGPYPVFANGLPLPFSEAEAKVYLAGEEIVIFINLNQGDAAASAWGCDLTYDYIKINASYRT